MVVIPVSQHIGGNVCLSYTPPAMSNVMVIYMMYKCHFCARKTVMIRLCAYNSGTLDFLDV